LKALRERLAELADLGHIGQLLEWDQQTMMPLRGAESRAESRATLERIAHELFVSDQTGRLLDEAGQFGADFRVRTVQSGFAGWFNFSDQPGAAVPPAWKESLVVLLVLYPVVFFFSIWVSMPHLRGVPFWLALFLGNLFSVFVTGLLLIPWANRVLVWWLVPRRDAPAWTNAAGIALVVAIYCVCFAVFSLFPIPK